MKKIMIALIIVVLLIPLTVYANSSWVWLTTSPLPILPYAAIATILIETYIIHRFNALKNVFVTFIVIALANAVSFILPLLWVVDGYMEVGRSFSIINAVAHWPYFIVGIGFLFLTLAVEMPIVYFSLRNRAKDKKMLIKTIVIANVITTVLISVIERIFCVGQW